MIFTGEIPEMPGGAGAGRTGDGQGIILHRISVANELFHARGDMLRCDARLRAMVDELGRRIDATQRAMGLLDIVATCKRCDELEGGSCCGAGIENKYEVPLLVLNLLMGVELPTERVTPGSCWFLGERGCVLRSRHVLCVNYLCSKIDRQLSREGRAMLQDATGLELETSFFASELIVRFMNRGGQGGRGS